MLSPILARLLCIAALLTSMSSLASAQILDDAWFEVRARATGFRVSEDGELTKIKRSGRFWVGLSSPGAGSGPDGSTAYSFNVISETADGNFALTSSGMLAAFEDGDELVLADFDQGSDSCGVKWFASFPGEENTTLQFLFLGRCKVKLGKQGELKSARLGSLGATVPRGAVGVDGVIGTPMMGAKLRGRLVRVEDLPFTL